MHIDLIEDFDSFEQLRPNWEAVYAADPESQFFLTWRWLWDFLHVLETRWCILAAKAKATDTDYVAFLPLRQRVGFNPKTGFHTSLSLGGDGFSDYNGVLTRPEHEAEAVPALIQYVKRRLDWGEFKLDNLAASERRRRLLLAPFDRPRFTSEQVSYFDRRSKVDNGLCFALDLPGDWEAYLAGLSSGSRQKMRRLLRKVEDGDEYRIAVAGPDTAAQDIDTLMRFWKLKWGLNKGARLAGIIERNTRMLNHCAEAGTLFLPSLWQGDRPLVLFGSLLDPCRKTLFFLITGRDETFDDLPAGYILHAFSIRHAIAQGLRSYDFLHGDEPYKRLFGPVRETRLTPTIVRTRTGRNLSGRVDATTLPIMLGEAARLETEGQFADAELAYRQIVEAAPQDPEGLYRWGRFLAQRKVWAEAVEVLRRCVAAAPTGDNGWMWLGRALEGQGDRDGAARAYRKAVQLEPRNARARGSLIDLSLPSAVPASQPDPPAWTSLLDSLKAAGGSGRAPKWPSLPA